MANCYVCPECGEYLDWSEAASAEFVSSFCAELRKKYAGEKR